MHDYNRIAVCPLATWLECRYRYRQYTRDSNDAQGNSEAFEGCSQSLQAGEMVFRFQAFLAGLLLFRTYRLHFADDFYRSVLSSRFDQRQLSRSAGLAVQSSIVNHGQSSTCRSREAGKKCFRKEGAVQHVQFADEGVHNESTKHIQSTSVPRRAGI